MLEPEIIPVNDLYLDRIEVHTLETLPRTIHDDANQLLLNSGISDLVGIEDPITDCSEFGSTLYVVGMSGAIVMSHMAFTFQPGSFGAYAPEQVQRLVQIRTVASRIQKSGIFTAATTTFVRNFLDGNEGIINLILNSEDNPNGFFSGERVLKVMDRPIFLMSSTIHPFALSLVKTLIPLGFSVGTDAVKKATGNSNQVILEPAEEHFSLRLIHGAHGTQVIEGVQIPVRIESTQTFIVDFDATSAILMAQLQSYKGNEPYIDLEHKVIALSGHTKKTQTGIVRKLKKVIAGKDSLTDATKTDMRVVLEKH